MSEQQPKFIADALATLPPEFAQFGTRYAADILPQLELRESDRLAAVAKSRQHAIAGAGVAAIAGIAGLVFFHSGGGFIVGAMVGLLIYAIGQRELQALAEEVKTALIKPVAQAFGMTYELVPHAGIVDHLKGFQLLPSYDRMVASDGLTGERHGMPFEFIEAHLEEQRRTSDGRGRTRTEWVTVFRGQCLAVRFPKAFVGVTRVLHDGGGAGLFRLFGDRKDRVKLEDPVFEKQFEVYSNDQIEARYILTPDFMERLLRLEQAFRGRNLRCAFVGGEMLLAVEGENLFEAGSMHRPMNDPGRITRMLSDFAAMFSLMDAMWARRPVSDNEGGIPGT